MRQQHSFYAVLLYIASTIFVLFLAINNKLGSNEWNSVFWIIQLFVCVNAVAKSFLQENKGRLLYYYSIVSAGEFIISKLIYNALLMLLMCLISLGLFVIFLDNPVVFFGRFVLIVLLGGFSLSLVFTLMSAIAGKAAQNAALIPILGFPVMLPLLLLLIRMSRYAFGEAFREGALLQAAGLVVALDALVLIMAVILYPYLWKE